MARISIIPAATRDGAGRTGLKRRSWTTLKLKIWRHPREAHSRCQQKDEGNNHQQHGTPKPEKRFNATRVQEPPTYMIEAMKGSGMSILAILCPFSNAASIGRPASSTSCPG